MKYLILVSVAFLSIPGLAQKQQQQSNKNMKVEMTREAHYPEGDNALYGYIFRHLKYSEDAKKHKVEGEVTASFMVERDSTITNVKIIKDPGHGVGEGVKALLQQVKFVPAMENGVPMKSKVLMNIPVRAH